MKKIEKIIFPIINVFMRFVNKFFGVDNNKVVFTSFNGRAYSDNPKAISETLHEINPNIKIIWIFEKNYKSNDNIPSYIKKISRKSVFTLYHYATSKVWVDNFNKLLFFYKSPEQVYIQTWHGDRAIKKILYDAWKDGLRPEPLFETKNCDYIVTGSIFAEKMYKSAYKFENDFLKVGSPRNDVLFQNEKKDTVYKSLNISKDTKVLLYAPTFRNEFNKKFNQSIDLDIEEILNTLKYVTEEDWVCLIRAHRVSGGFSFSSDDNRIIDITNYEDMADILSISNVLITDYSSSATDLILTDKPVLLFQPDLHEYMSNDRELYNDIEEIGFLSFESNESLISFINSKFNKTDFKDINKRVSEFYGVYEDGNASIKMANFINNIIMEKIND